jgi:copper chaperone NosL
MKSVGAGSLLSALFVSFCSQGPPPAAALDTAHESCRFCRMAISDARLAGQIVAPYEEPIFFDDIGCLRDFLAEKPVLGPHAIAYVADHLTGEWLPATRALFTRNESVETPMGSHLIAHADESARRRDPMVEGGALLTPRDVFGPSGPPEGQP